jgi:hypothetical protein
MKLYSALAISLSALIMALAVFIGNVSHSEFKSQMRKRKVARIAASVINEVETVDNILTDTCEDVF